MGLSTLGEFITNAEVNTVPVPVVVNLPLAPNRTPLIIVDQSTDAS
jgi:hypothetical protein